MSVCVNVQMSKIMCMPVKLGVRTYVTHAYCRTLNSLLSMRLANSRLVHHLEKYGLFLISDIVSGILEQLLIF